MNLNSGCFQSLAHRPAMDAGGVNAERLGHQTQLQAVVEVYSVAHRNVERLPSPRSKSLSSVSETSVAGMNFASMVTRANR